MPLFSVIIPTYNRARIVTETIQGVLGQSCRDLEVIVVDDGSTDNTQEHLRSLFGSKIIYARQPNQGVSVARNAGIAAAKGEYLVFLDDDDWLAPEMLATCKKSFERMSCDALYGKAVLVDDNRKFVKDMYSPDLSEEDLFQATMEGKILAMGQFAIRKSCVAAVGGFNVQTSFGEDWEFMLLTSRKFKYTFIPQNFVFRRQHNANRHYDHRLIKLVEERMQLLDQIFGVEAQRLRRRYVTRQVVADWYSCVGEELAQRISRRKAAGQMLRSLWTWPWQPRIYAWFIKQIVPGPLLRLWHWARTRGFQNDPAPDERPAEDILGRKPLVSVIIPAYNAARVIVETVNSVLNQTYRNLELIVVDDGSKDATKEKLSPYLHKIRYLFQQNQGESKARNLGIREAKGEYVVFLDADDLLAHDMIEQCLFAFSSHNRFKVVYGPRASFRDGEQQFFRQESRPSGTGSILPAIIRGSTLVPGQFMVHRDCFKLIGGFSEDMKYGEDWEFLLRLAARFEFLHVDTVFVKKRIHKSMQSFSKDRPDIVVLRRGILERVFKQDAPRLQRQYLSRPVVADWYRSFAFSYVDSGDRVKARHYVLKSLGEWPLQPKLWVWFLSQAVSPALRQRVKSLKNMASKSIV